MHQSVRPPLVRPPLVEILACKQSPSPHYHDTLAALEARPIHLRSRFFSGCLSESDRRTGADGMDSVDMQQQQTHAICVTTPKKRGKQGRTFN